MRYSEAVRMADDGEHSPVWARSRRRRGNPIVVGPFTLLALFGVLTAGLAIKEGSLAKGGVIMDGWIAEGLNTVKGRAPDAAGATVAAANRAGVAAQAGATAASGEFSKQ